MYVDSRFEGVIYSVSHYAYVEDLGSDPVRKTNKQTNKPIANFGLVVHETIHSNVMNVNSKR